jgi:hypothetical protein
MNVVDRHRVAADPDPAFYFNANPDLDHSPSFAVLHIRIQCCACVAASS